MLLAVGCGKKEDSSIKPPVTPAPDQTSTTPPPAAIPTPTPDPRLPDMTGSTVVFLSDKANYSGLSDLAGNFFGPLVGDARLVLHLPKSRTQAIYGDMTFGFEDNQGFWGASLSSFDGANSLAANKLDMIFADNELLFHVIGTLSGDKLVGSIYYRVRLPSDATIRYTVNIPNYGNYTTDPLPYCVKPNIQCTVSYPAGYNGPSGTQNTTTSCPNLPVIDSATPCKTFMATTDSNVKKLGTFDVNYSNWTTLSEDK